MKVLELLVIGLIAYTVIYMILKYIALRQEYESIQQPVQECTKKTIEITSKDLYCKAQNLIEMHEIYALQIEQIVEQINRVEETLEIEKASCIRSDIVIKPLVAESLRLQEQKCRIEAKMLKIQDDLDKIAKEEYKRQLVQ